jgi:hypothetical protein
MTKIAGSGSRIRNRIHKSEAWIRRSGSGSTPKCHGSATLFSRVVNDFTGENENFKYYYFINNLTTRKQNCKNHRRMYRKYLFKIISLKIINIHLVTQSLEEFLIITCKKRDKKLEAEEWYYYYSWSRVQRILEII